MVIGVTLFIITVLIAAIWVIIEIKRLKHKLFAILLIGLVLFSYISFSVVLKGENIDYKSISGLTDASKIYFSWLGSIFGNLKSVTTYAIKQDWDRADTSPSEDTEE